MADQADDLGIPMKPARPTTATKDPPTTADLSRLLAQPATTPISPTSVLARPAGQPGQSIASLGPRTDQSARLPNTPVEAKTLIVGQGTSLSGEINSCERLVVEGSIRANLQACRSMLIAETGLFSGNAAIDDVDIYGRFEGDLAVRKRLLIRASGDVSGTISYGQIEVEAGGKIAGSVQSTR
jgi:cytoskeletal protein CcmA (bactofilin family)